MASGWKNLHGRLLRNVQGKGTRDHASCLRSSFFTQQKLVIILDLKVAVVVVVPILVDL